MTEAHSQKKTITELAYYPSHSERESSKEYRKNHNWLVHVEERPCKVCGKTWEEARDDDEWLETHHKIEWAEFNYVNKDEFAKLFDPDSDGTTYDQHGYATELRNSGRVSTPDDIRVLEVLCTSCHRLKETGIHETTGPIYLANSITDDGRTILKKSEGDK